MQCNVCDIDTHSFNVSKLFFCKVQTRSWRGRRTYLVGVDCLIALFVFEFFGDVRRQRHLTYLVQRRKEICAVSALKSCDAVAVFQHFGYLGSQKTAPEYKAPAHTRLFARSAKYLPFKVAPLFHKQELNERVCVLSFTVDTRRQNTRVVQHQQVTFSEVVA